MARTVGLDIGSSSVKATQAKNTKNGPVVEKVAVLPLTPGVVQEGLVSPDAREKFVEDLKAFFKREKLSKDVVLGMNNSSAVTWSVEEIRYRDPEFLSSSLLYEIEHRKVFSVRPDELKIDYVVLGEKTTPEGRFLTVLVLAVSRAKLEENVAAVTAAGLNVVGVDLNALAVLRTVPIGYHETSTYDAVIDLGADLATMVIHHNGVPMFFFFSPTESGNGVTALVQKRLALNSFADAEAVKHSPENHSPQAVELVRRCATTAAHRMNETIRQFLVQHPECHGISSITLVGGGALLDGLRSSFEEISGTPVDVGTYDNGVFAGNTDLLTTTPFGPTALVVSAGLTTGSRL